MTYPKEIWRYDITPASLGSTFVVKMPMRATIVHVGLKASVTMHDIHEPTPHFWAEVEPGMAMEDVTFMVVATGMAYDSADFMHVGTFVINQLVFHLLKKIP